MKYLIRPQANQSLEREWRSSLDSSNYKLFLSPAVFEKLLQYYFRDPSLGDRGKATFLTRSNFYALAFGEIFFRFYKPRDYGTRQSNAIVRHASRTQIREKFEVYLCCSNFLHKTTRHTFSQSTNTCFRTLRSTRPEPFPPCLLLFPSNTVLYAYLTFLVSKDISGQMRWDVLRM